VVGEETARLGRVGVVERQQGVSREQLLDPRVVLAHASSW
jgi:hypothetical protein